MIYIVDDDREFAECIAKMVQAFSQTETRIFSNGIEAISAMNEELPDLIFLDILLNGPDGFTFLNELMSYNDTERIPVVIMSSLRFEQRRLEDYGVVAILDKMEMVPGDVKAVVEKYVK